MECPEDQSSKIKCYPSKCGKKELLEDLAIFPLSDDVSAWLDEYPVHWYSVGRYIFSIPDNRVTDADIKSIAFQGHFNVHAVKRLADSLEDIN